MKRIIKKSICITSALILMAGAFANMGGVFADETVENTETYDEYTLLPSLIDIASDENGITYFSPEKVIKNTYWADLEEGKVKGTYLKHDLRYDGIIPIEEETVHTGVFPKYLLKPGETALQDSRQQYNKRISNFRRITSTGITKENYDLETRYFARFHRLGYLVSHDVDIEGSSYSDKGIKATDPVPARENPLGIKESEVLRQDEIDDSTKLTIYGDIKESGDTDSNKIKDHKVGDELKLDFSINASWFKRYMMGDALQMTRGDLSDEKIKDIIDNTDGMFDSQIVYTIDIPKEVDVRTPSASLTGLNDFDTKAEVKDEVGKKKLVVTLRLKADKQAKKEPWKNIVEKLRKLDVNDIKVSLSGLYVNSNARPGTNVTLRGTVGGYFEYMRTKLDNDDAIEILEDKDGVYGMRPDVNIPNYTYLYFVAKQSDDGRDQAAPADKQNLISYTFKLDDKKTNPPVDPKKPVDPKTPDSPKKPDSGRIDGKDRIETAINISKKNYDKAKSVIVVRHDLFPDSMTASVLAKLKDAPILLNPTAKLDSRVGDEIKRLGAEEVIIVGGQDSVSEKVREDLKVYDADKNVERIAGADRYGTSEMVAKRVVGITGKKNTGVVASGQVFPDALSVGTFASREGYPILLVKKDSVPSQIERAIKDLEINKTYIAGGTNTISKSTEAKLPGVLERMAGNTRYETSVAIAKSKFGASKEAYIASGEEFADALVISPISGKFNRPTLLVSRNKNTNSPVRTYIRNAGFTSITAIGGERFVPYSVLEDLVK
nr:cell wall-binding repeat-containing protein [uncultured Peptostreptococcus sp.]